MWTWDDVDPEYLIKLMDEYPNLVRYIRSIEELSDKAMMSYVTYMTERILEMHRILKLTGGFYLHCDTTASHYLKLVLDRVFWKNNFQNEIVWKRTNSPKAQSKSFGRQYDVIFYYSKGSSFVFNKVYRRYDEKALKAFRYVDSRGRYQTVSIVARGTQKYDERRSFDFQGVRDYWLYKREQLEAWWEDGLIHVSKKGGYRKKEYLHESKGIIVSDLFVDDAVEPMQGKSSEVTGYPTQKPLALLERIIRASSHDGDVVLDPFCGCATTCVAAQHLNRRWVGIDVSEQARWLVAERLGEDPMTPFTDFVALDKPPVRSDVAIIERPGGAVKERLFREQGVGVMGV